jgi:DNA-binding transcriptional LysR family regulator
MEMHQIRYFLAVGEVLNFTRAAEKCNVSQPALTRAIQGLEHELGGPLFHRERNHTHLTELGRLMHPFLETVFRQSREAKEKAKAFGTLTDAPLTVGVMCTIGPAKLLDLFTAFRETHPGVDIQMRDAKGKALRDMLAAGDLDVAIFGLPEEIGEQFHAMPLFEERFVIAVNDTHPFAAKKEIRFVELHQQRYLSRINCEVGDVMMKLYEEKGVQVIRPYRSERDDWIQIMCKAGLGLLFIPEFAITVDGLVVRPLVDPELKRTIQLVTVRGRPQSPAVGAFVRDAMRWRNRQNGAKKAAA